MTQTEFNKFYKGANVQVVWDNSITGKIADYVIEQGMVWIILDNNQTFPLDQLEFSK
jgi:hypothetical protein